MNENVFAAINHMQTSGQIQLYNKIIVIEYCQYVEQPPENWKIYTDIPAFEYTTQILETRNITQFKIVLSQPSKLAIYYSNADCISRASRESYPHRRIM